MRKTGRYSNSADWKDLLEKVDGLKQKHDRELAESVLEVSAKANRKIVEELIGDEAMYKALLEIMGPEIDKIVYEKATILANEKSAILANSIVKRMIVKGKFTIKEVSEYTGLSIKDIHEMVESMSSSGKNKRPKSGMRKRPGKIQGIDERYR